MPAPARRNNDVIQIRTSAKTKAMLDRAAALRGQKLSEFILEAPASGRRDDPRPEHILAGRQRACTLARFPRFAPQAAGEVRTRFNRKPPWKSDERGRCCTACPRAAPRRARCVTRSQTAPISRLTNGFATARVPAKASRRAHTWSAQQTRRIASSAISRSLPRWSSVSPFPRQSFDAACPSRCHCCLSGGSQSMQNGKAEALDRRFWSMH